MEKVLVGIYVPATQEHFDLFVPSDLDIQALTGLVAQGVDELCGGRYTSSKREMLALQETALLLNPSFTLSQYGIGDGAQLVML